jgi:hypothetical protein
MRAILLAPLGLALSISAFALTFTPASAIEIRPASVPAVSSQVAKVSERCRRWEYRCRELYPAGGWRYRRCMALHGCGG